MKRITALLLCVVLLLTSCNVNIQITEQDESLPSEYVGDVSEYQQKENIYETDKNYWGLSAPDLLRFMEDTVYTGLVKNLDSENYFVENVTAIYISKEYIDEITYNSQPNIFFGYTLAELDSVFQGTKYIFTLGENGETIVREEQAITNTTYDDAIKNVTIGTGVILICVVISAVSGGVGAPAVAAIFAVSAKTGAVCALSGMVISGVSAGIAKGYETEDFDQALKAAVSSGSEGFKWGAISGVITGGTQEAIALKGATLNGLSMNDAAAIQKESGLPLDVIKQFKSYEEYNVYKTAGLKTGIVNGRIALVRDIDLSYESELPNGEKVTNLTRMQKGYAPLDPATNKAYQLHHINQDPDGTLAILTEEEHQGNSAILNLFGKESEIDRTSFNATRKEFWQSFAKGFTGG